MRYLLLVIGVIGVGVLVLSLFSFRDTQLTVRVVASIYPYGFIAQELVKDDASVTVVVPPGAEAHDFEPSPKSIALLSEADIVIANGGGIEPWLDEIQKTRAKLGKPTLIMLPQGAKDPHIWLDLSAMEKFTGEVSDALVQVDPKHAPLYRSRAVALQQKFGKLDAQFRESLADCEYDTAIVAHDAFSYLARAYNLTFIPVAGISPEEEPSAKKIAELIDLARSRKVHAVYFEFLTDPSVMQTLADEAGVIALPLDPVETISKDDSKVKNYLTIMQENRKQLQKGLVCRQ